MSSIHGNIGIVTLLGMAKLNRTELEIGQTFVFMSGCMQNLPSWLSNDLACSIFRFLSIFAGHQIWILEFVQTRVVFLNLCSYFYLILLDIALRYCDRLFVCWCPCGCCCLLSSKYLSNIFEEILMKSVLIYLKGVGRRSFSVSTRNLGWHVTRFTPTVLFCKKNVVRKLLRYT